MHVGFTGTRFGMTSAQIDGIRETLDDRLMLLGFAAHHGDCIGADAEFHQICREARGGQVAIIKHPGPLGAFSAGCIADECMDPMPHMKRNRAIVNSSTVMIAAPFEDEPQRRGGTWATIAMARKALKLHLRELYVVGRDGALLDHTRWP